MPIKFGSPEAAAIRNRDRKLTAAQAEAAKPIPEHERRAYIALADCGCVQGVCTDDPRRPKETAKFVADFIRCGLKVENVDWARYREICKESTYFACPHSDPPADHPTLITQP